MAWPRFVSAMRYLLDCVREGLMCLGQCIGPSFDISATAPAETTRAKREAEPEPQQPAAKPLTEAEHAEWTALVKRLG
ncbi:hypothetical protein DMH04_27470 [Kibdelosporangium aridum]|uniref:Uncharacterized protein n=1 Tax=Kibdelosporangium aridum TaxID=2030 RepID=A0A428Z4P9_KIBAR|nr:hypothetical protein [Kibdelosporangium aridum]RSM81621.1 hypothetical protein DMH04_27470 [Kibdelosporangium aridum]